MHALYLLSGLLLILFSQFGSVAGKPTPANTIGMQKYTRSHSFGDNYAFDPQDGWQIVNVTNLQYKYRRDFNGEKHEASPKHHTGVGGAIQGALEDVWNGLRGIGVAQDVTITWYTGHDLLSPSCWSKSTWAPTDESFACALTLKGWADRPKCFEFLECCAQGSKHVDLTKAAFKALADLDVGILTVKMRRATRPKTWNYRLWGPQSLEPIDLKPASN
ncbi:hypothetical protein AN958_00860 [Leucoagaricus sp. SymC.cos]|nr:hypothetical protein AN958_00860 [Leucoagaricus sp. SymC.cos]